MMFAPERKFIGFSRKIFWAIFLSCLGILSVAILSASKIFSSWILEEYQSRYSSLSSLIGENIREMEESAERTMLNAALLVKSLDRYGPLSTPELKAIAKRTNVTHLFVIDQDGNFIRSTNEDPSLIPNFFSFCGDYRNRMGIGDTTIDVTPIIQPTPEPSPFKFLIISNETGDRLISVGLRVDFLASSLKRFQGQDSNIESIEIYSPNGGLLGAFRKEGVQLVGDRLMDIPPEDFTLKEENERLVYSQWAASNHPDCCQCRTSGDVRNNRYDYLIRTQVSKDALVKAQNSLLVVLGIFTLFSVLISFILARLISVRLVARLRRLHSQVKENIANPRELRHLDESGADELSELSQSFNELLHQREEYRKEKVEFERLKKEKELSDLAAQVSHDIQSPLSTLKTLTHIVRDRMETEERQILSSVTSRLQEMTSALLRRYRGEQEIPAKFVVDLKSTIERIIEEKKLEFKDQKRLKILTRLEPELNGIKIDLSETELARIFSNLINNSVEASEGQMEIYITVTGSLTNQGQNVLIQVIDNGPGFPKNLIRRINSEIVYPSKEGRGLGLKHARECLKKLGGRLKLFSRHPHGAHVSLIIPVHNTEFLKSTPAEIVLIDNDSTLRRAWALQAHEMGINFFTGENESEIPFYRISKDAQIFVDGNLAEGRSGVEILKSLHEQGFTNLFLASNDERIILPDYAVRTGKDFPFSRSA